MSASRAERAVAHAVDVARGLEKHLEHRDPADIDLLTEACEIAAHPDGALGIVLDVRGPHVALVLGRGAPFVEVWWGGAVAREAVALDRAAAARFVDTWWRPDISNTPFEASEQFQRP
jgi:hypothetical protein